MAESPIAFRSALAQDAPAMARVDAECWPASLATSATEFTDRIAAYSEGQLVAESERSIVGTSSAQRITAAFLRDNGHRYDLVTDRNRFTNSHQPDGEVYQLVGVAVLPELRGSQLGRKLVDEQIRRARALPQVRRILGFTRPIRYHIHQNVSIDEYVNARGDDGRLLDPVLSFHVDAGARVVSVHAGFRPEDRESCGFGVLIEYPAS